MMRKDTQQTLIRLTNLVQAKLSALPAYDWQHREAHDRALQAICRDLEIEESARFGAIAGSETMTLAGVRSTCSSGRAGLLNNWIAAARRRLDKAVVAGWAK